MRGLFRSTTSVIEGDYLGHRLLDILNSLKGLSFDSEPIDLC